MATIVNNPASSDQGGGMGFLLGAVLLIVFGALFFFYGLPYLSGTVQGPQIPSTIDVNVNEK